MEARIFGDFENTYTPTATVEQAITNQSNSYTVNLSTLCIFPLGKFIPDTPGLRWILQINYPEELVVARYRQQVT